MRTGKRIVARIDPRFSPFLLLVRRSPIDRYGIFAGETIPRNRRVIEYTGERITYRTANGRFRRILRSGRPRRFYFFVLNKRWVIDGSAGGTGAELVNHSCEPNLVRRRIAGHIYYYSRKRVRSGEELSVDYRFSKDTIRCKCRCGAPKCRGTINLK